jgi:hypothetical protein
MTKLAMAAFWMAMAVWFAILAYRGGDRPEPMPKTRRQLIAAGAAAAFLIAVKYMVG